MKEKCLELKYIQNILSRYFQHISSNNSKFGIPKNYHSVVSLKGIQSDKMVVEWKGTVNTFINKRKREIQKDRQRIVRHTTNPQSKDRYNAVLTVYIVTDIVSPHDWERVWHIPLQHLPQS